MTVEAAVLVNAPENPIVQIDRALFARIEEQEKRVVSTAHELKVAADEHKEAKSAYDNATKTLTALVASMVRRVNGISDTPLFDNMSEAIDAANADPIVTGLLNRMIDHGITHLNALVVAGYDEAQRNELTAYLDAMDLRKKALDQPDGFEPVPEVPEVPAFLVEQEPEPISDETVKEALAGNHIVLKKKHLKLLSQAQRAEVLAYTKGCDEARERLGEALTFEDLPLCPSYVTNPSELEPKDEDTEGASEATMQAVESAEAHAEKKKRAPKRSSKDFKNTPKMVKAKRGKAAR